MVSNDRWFQESKDMKGENGDIGWRRKGVLTCDSWKTQQLLRRSIVKYLYPSVYFVALLRLPDFNAAVVYGTRCCVQGYV
jgi:hypothetical protein